MLFKVHGCACQIDVCGVQWLKQSVCGGLRDKASQLYRHQAVAGDCKYLLPEAMTGDILCLTVMRGQPATCAANITQLHPAAAWCASVHCVSPPRTAQWHTAALLPPRPGVKNSLSGPSLARPDSHSAAPGRATVHCLAEEETRMILRTHKVLLNNCQARVSLKIRILTFF